MGKLAAEGVELNLAGESSGVEDELNGLGDVLEGGQQEELQVATAVIRVEPVGYLLLAPLLDVLQAAADPTGLQHLLHDSSPVVFGLSHP